MFTKVQTQARQLPRLMPLKFWNMMIKWSYESFWSQYYMFLGESFGAEFLGTLLSCQIRYKKKKEELLSRRIKTLFGRSSDTAKIEWAKWYDS